MDTAGCKSHLVNEEPVVVVDWREDQSPGDGLWLDPPGLQVSGHIVHKQGISQADVLSREIHSQHISFSERNYRDAQTYL